MLLKDNEGKLVIKFLEPTDPTFICNNDELCIAFTGILRQIYLCSRTFIELILLCFRFVSGYRPRIS